MAAFVVGLSFLSLRWLLYFLCKASCAGLYIRNLLMYQILAGKCLQVEAKKVYRALCCKDIRKARKLLFFILLAEIQKAWGGGYYLGPLWKPSLKNTTDGVIAPMIFMAIEGAFGLCLQSN